jgi:hypothetical protein
VRKLALILILCFAAFALPASAARAPITASRDWWPVWSPGDRDIAFTRSNGTGRIFSLMVYDLATHRSTLVGSSAGQLAPSWSPDGGELAYASGGIVYVVDRDGSGKRRYSAPAKAFAPMWRPGTSGELAYLTTHGAANTDLWVGNVRWAQNVTGQPSWGDGGQIAFARDDGIYVATGPGDERQVVGVANPGSPAWSPDGTFIAYAANRNVWIIRADGTSPGPLRIAGPYRDPGPLSWSRESDLLAFTVPGAVEVTQLESYRTVKVATGGGVGASFAHHSDRLAFAGVHPGCSGHSTIRLYEDAAHMPSLTGGCGIAGTSGGDVIYGTGQGGDRIAAGGGNDVVHAANGHRDTVSCGAGRDTVHADRSDRLTGCEVVRR